MSQPHTPRAGSIDTADVARFDRLAAEWWDPQGPMRALHRINPLRVGFLRDATEEHFDTSAQASAGHARLAGLRVLDIGCGAGILCEPLARLGASVTGIDPAPGPVAVARDRAGKQNLAIDYRASTAEALAAAGESFDVVLAMEVVEHVTNMPAFVATACGLVRPGGLFVASTLNRTLKSFALAIIGAEYVLGWMPKGTHQWEKFVTPDELADAIEAAGLRVFKETGMVFEPLGCQWRLSADVGVNYFMTAVREQR